MSGRVLAWAALVIATVVLPARADELAPVLTGGSSRAWVAQPVVRAPEGGPSCQSGEIWTFATTGVVTVNRCDRGVLVATEHAWSASKPADGAATLAITGMGVFAASLGANAHWLRLRPGDGNPGTERELRRDDD